ncbi:hypothetical protein [Nostoc sp. LPT]|uniref:hypothetical protein n=1 Tax=Nostoc sp. LPT TaxID=2815387 RepID=UPI001D9A1794|nr:hypothetical protein [Nostoc sp. LPT]MBN4002926.1 hypothetical protein [Nostoc sp. LPT]
MKAGFDPGKAEFDTECAKHPNVKAEFDPGKAEFDTDCAKHSNVKAEVDPGKAEAVISAKSELYVTPNFAPIAESIKESV